MKKLDKFLLWLPRVITILFILFISLFSLDIFDMQLGFWGTLVGLFMHNIPSFILIIVAILSWRRYLLGAVIFTSLAALYMLLFGKPFLTKLPLTLIATFVAICYFLSYRFAKN